MTLSGRDNQSTVAKAISVSKLVVTASETVKGGSISGMVEYDA